MCLGIPHMPQSPADVQATTTRWPEGDPCKHPGCLHHISHPCEGCGRIGGRYPEAKVNYSSLGILCAAIGLAGFICGFINVHT